MARYQSISLFRLDVPLAFIQIQIRWVLLSMIVMSQEFDPFESDIRHPESTFNDTRDTLELKHHGPLLSRNAAQRHAGFGDNLLRLDQEPAFQNLREVIFYCGLYCITTMLSLTTPMCFCNHSYRIRLVTITAMC